jgi:cell division transport system permease protein
MRWRYILSEVFTGLWRNVTMTIAMIITMALSLGMLGGGILLFWQVDRMEKFFFARVEVSIFLKADITDEQRSALDQELRADPLVATNGVTYESREEAYNNFKQLYRDSPDLVESVKPDTLPESFRVKLKDPEKFKEISERYKDKAGVDDIVDQKELLGRVFDILGSLQTSALLVAIFMGVAALLLVANTIQVAAYSKRREVAVMKLVGASNWFIQAPFVLEAVFAGLIGSIIAFGFLMIGWWVLFSKGGSLESLETVLTPVEWTSVLLMLPILAGISALVSAVTGWVTLRFYVRV